MPVTVSAGIRVTGSAQQPDISFISTPTLPQDEILARILFGGAEAGQAIGPGLILEFSRHMNHLLELDVAARTVRGEPGLVLDELNARLKPHGLQLPLDLSTANRATIGGMIANAVPKKQLTNPLFYLKLLFK